MKPVNRRQFLGDIFTGTGAFITGSCFSRASYGRTSPPNIIFLLADDLRWDCLGCMGNSIIKTPHLDRLATEGTVFDEARVTTSICAASRATLLSGRYVCNHGINDFSKTFTKEQFSDTYPALLRKAGYRTGFVGKYGVGTVMPESEYDFWKGYEGQGNYDQKDVNGAYKHITQVQEEDALSFLDSCHKDKPFCLSVSFKAPHCQDGDIRQFIFEPRYADLYADIEIPPPETAKISYEDRFPNFFRQNNEARIRWEVRFSNPELYQKTVRNYYRLVTGLDRVVGSLREKIAAMGLENNTLFVFTSDNGFFLGDYGLAGKWYGYEPSIRVPLIVYDPNIPEHLRGQRCSALSLNLDIAPTLLDYAGIVPPQSMQGKSLVPWIRNASIPWREDFYYEHTFPHPGIPKSEGVVSPKYKYLRYTEQNPAYEELFDLEKDPLEVHNLAVEPEYNDILQQMRSRCDQLKQEFCT